MSKFRQWLSARPLAANAFTMLMGTGLAQIIPFVTAPIIARLYPPDERAVLTYFASIMAALTTFAALRYEQTIMIAKSDSEARLLVRASLRISLAMSLLSTAVAFLLAPWVGKILNSPSLTALLPWVGLGVFATMCIAIWGYWLNRKQRYRALSINRIQTTGVTAAAQIAAPYAGLGGPVGLVGGNLVSLVIGAVTMGFWARSSNLRGNPVEPGTPSTKELLKQHYRMPCFNLPTAAFDAIRINAIPLLVGYFYGNYAAGNFGYAWMLTQAPVVLLAGSLSQVYYQHLATTPRAELRGRVVVFVRRGLLIGIVPFTVLALIAPWFFPFYLGEGWELAGWLSTALAPWLYLNSVTSPIASILVITNSQAAGMVFSAFFMVAPMISLTVAAQLGWGILGAMVATSVVMTLMLIVFIFLILWAAGKQEEPC